MALLVHLVKADGLDADELFHVGKVRLGAGEAGDARAGKGHLGGGGELEDHVGVAVPGALGEDVREGHEFPFQLMDAVGVVPHEEEVRGGGLQGSKAADGLLGVNVALGVGVLGDIPHALDLGVLHSGLHGVHIRAVGGHGDGDELEAEGLRDLEVAVIAGGGAEPLEALLFAPGLFRMEQAVGHGLADGVVHQLEAGVAAGEDLALPTSQDLREEPPGGGEAGQLAVVAAVHAVGEKVLRRMEDIEKAADHVQLLLAGLAPGHVQLQALGLQGVILRPDGGQLRLQLRPGEVPVFLHGDPSFRFQFFTI